MIFDHIRQILYGVTLRVRESVFIMHYRHRKCHRKCVSAVYLLFNIQP